MANCTNNLNLSRAFENLANEARELYLPEEVFKYCGPPTSLDFYRNWVCPNIPVIFKGSIAHWQALRKWTPSYLRRKLGRKEVSVAVTPNGLADAVYNDRFVLPEERKMHFSDFLNLMESPGYQLNGRSGGVFYIQKQNSNFTEEFPEIVGDAATEIDWATQAFAKSPDAVNFWMGNNQAVTSLHKDHYENLYCVISGEKTFTLYPPTDLPYIPHGRYKPARYCQKDSGKFEIIDIQDKEGHDETIPWIPVDPLKPDYTQYPEFAKATPVTCTIGPGDVLYLPSLWFHHVQQKHGTIAINFWYDMEYDIKYNYYKFMENVLKVISKSH